MKGTISTDSSSFLVWPFAVFLPVSALLVGILATLMRLSVPSSGDEGFLDVFVAYALRFPSDFNIIRWAAPALGLAILFLLSIAIRSAWPVVTLVSIRIILLVLIAVITISVKVFSVVLPISPSSVTVEMPFEASASMTAYLFLFIDVDLILVFLATFLPIYRRLNKRLI